MPHAPRPRSLHGSRLALLAIARLAIALTLLACRPALDPLPGSEHALEPLPPADELTLTLVPPASPSAAPRVLRLHLASAGLAVDPVRVVLARGSAGPAQLRQVQRGEISATLEKRLVPVQRWWEDRTGRVLSVEELPNEGEPVLVIAPELALEPDEDYALIVAEPPALLDLHIDPHDTAPLLERIWPPPGASATANFGLWCGALPLSPIEAPMTLAPTGPRGRVRRGLPGDLDLGQSCVHFAASPGELALEGGLPVPSLATASGDLRLDPRPFVAELEPHPLEALPCIESEQPFGPACATVHDDRLELRTPLSPALWAIAGEGLEHVLTTAAAEPVVLTGLTPDAQLELRAAVVDDRGELRRFLFAAETRPPMAHLVLNEVLANPLGPEPQQEWVELYNDGSIGVELEGHVLGDLGGDTLLPPGWLAPGAFALIVNEAFVEQDGLDPAPQAGTLILRVPKLGHAGLTNAGEPLQLRDATGLVVSRFPAGPKPKAGMSLSRRSPAIPDLSPAGFASSPPSPGRANEG